jgi:mRNA interferase YafQ
MKLIRHKQFLKDWAKTKLTDGQFSKFINYVNCLQHGEVLPVEAKDYCLHGNYKDYKEFHLGGDMLVIYLIEIDNLILARLGTHNQLF